MKLPFLGMINTKRWIGLSVWLIMISLFWFGGESFAQGTATTTADGSVTELGFTLIEAALNALYLFTLPLLIIAGKAMDNSMIYAEFLGIDRMLFLIWNVCRTLANFAVGGILLYKVFQFFRSSDTAPSFIKEFVIKATLVLLGINASWFALGALIDISTIVTYSVGALPLGSLKDISTSKGLAEAPLLSVATYFKYSAESATRSTSEQKKETPVHLYYKRGNINIPKCEYHKNIIIGPQYYPTVPTTDIDFRVKENMRQLCAMSTQMIVDITDLEQWKNQNLSEHIPDDNVPLKDGISKNDLKIALMKDIINELESGKGCNPGEGVVLFPYNTDMSQKNNPNEGKEIKQDKINDLMKYLTLLNHSHQKTFCLDQKNNNNGYLYTITTRIDDKMQDLTTKFQNNDPDWKDYTSQPYRTLASLIDNSQGMVGPFVTMYMSLLNFSNLSDLDANNTTIGKTVGNFIDILLKTVVGIVLFIPLVAISVMLIMRVVILWAVIAFSPLLIARFFLGEKKSVKIGKESYEFKDIIGLIFMPVTTVLALSLTLIVLQILNAELMTVISSDSPTWSVLGIRVFPHSTPGISCIDFWNMQVICWKEGQDGNMLNSGIAHMIPWLFLNIFAMGLLWMLLNVVMSANKFTGTVGGKIMEVGANMLGSIKVPIGDNAYTIKTWMNTPGMLSDHIERGFNSYVAADNQLFQENMEYELGKRLGDENNTTYTYNSLNDTDKKKIGNAMITTSTQSIDDQITAYSNAIRTYKGSKYGDAFNSLSREKKIEALVDMQKDANDRVKGANFNYQQTWFDNLYGDQSEHKDIKEDTFNELKTLLTQHAGNADTFKKEYEDRKKKQSDNVKKLVDSFMGDQKRLDSEFANYIKNNGKHLVVLQQLSEQLGKAKNTEGEDLGGANNSSPTTHDTTSSNTTNTTNNSNTTNTTTTNTTNTTNNSNTTNTTTTNTTNTTNTTTNPTSTGGSTGTNGSPNPNTTSNATPNPNPTQPNNTPTTP